MPDAYTTLYSKIRAAAGDSGTLKHGSVDTNSYMFRDAVIDANIELAVLDLSDYTTDGTQIVPSIATDNDTLLIVYTVAMFLLLDLVDEMMASESLTIKQSAPVRKLEFVATQVNRLLEEKGVVGSYDGSLAAIKNAEIRYSDRIVGIIESQ